MNNKGSEDYGSCFHFCGGFSVLEGQIQLKLEPTSQGSYPEKILNRWYKTTESVACKRGDLYYPLPLRLFSATFRHSTPGALFQGTHRQMAV